MYKNTQDITTKFFKTIDIYGAPVSLNIRSKTLYTTLLGGIFTTMTVLISTFFVYYFFNDMILKKYPYMNSYKKYIDNNEIRDLPGFDEDKMLLGFRLKYNNGTIINTKESPYFNLSIYEEQKNVLNYDSLENDKSIIDYYPCNTDYLNDISNNFSPDIKENEDLKKIFPEFECIHFENNKVYGSPLYSIKTQFIQFDIKLDLYKLLNDDYDINSINKLMPFEMQIIIQSYSYDPYNYDNPIQKVIGIVTVKLFIQSETNIIAGIMLTELNRYDDAIFNNNNQTNYFKFEDFNFYFTSNESKIDNIKLQNINGETIDNIEQLPIFSGKIHLDDHKMIYIYIREYAKIQWVLAESGAMIKTFYWFFFIVSYIYNMNRINEQLSYKFYKFNPEKNCKLVF